MAVAVALIATIVTTPVSDKTVSATTGSTATCDSFFGSVWGNLSFNGIAKDDTFDRNITSSVPVQDSDGNAMGRATNLPQPGSFEVAAPGVLANDQLDTINGTRIMLIPVNGDVNAEAVIVQGPAHAKSFVLNRDGSFRYIPRDGYFGADQFTYLFKDGARRCSSQATVQIPAIWRSYPVADTYTIFGDEPLDLRLRPCGFHCGVLENDVNLPRLDRELVTGWFGDGRPGGKLSNQSANGTFVFTPNPGFRGTSSFEYQLRGSVSRTQVTINVVDPPTPDQPVGSDDVVTTDEDVPLTIEAGTLLANDARANYITSVDSPVVRATTFRTANGRIDVVYGDIFSGDPRYQTARRVIYTPDANFNGIDSFVYYVATQVPFDSSPNPVTVRIDVKPVVDPPDLVNQFATTVRDQPVTVDLLKDAVDPDGLIDLIDLSTLQVLDKIDGDWRLNPDGTVVYTPNPGFVGTGVFLYALGGSNPPDGSAVRFTRVTVTRDDAVDDLFTTDEDTALTGNVRANDQVGAAGAATLVSSTTNGTLDFTTLNGRFTYTPNPNFSGTDRFTYAYVSAFSGQGDIGTVTITVRAVNDVPTVWVSPYCVSGEFCLFSELRDVGEGGTVKVSGYVTDVEFNPGTLTVGWGDGTTTTATYPCAGPRCAFGSNPTFSSAAPCLGCTDRLYFSFEHRYRDNPVIGDRYSIVVTADDGSVGSATTGARVTNIAPTLTITPADGVSALVGDEVTVTGIASDPGETTSVTVDWGDGSSPSPAVLTCAVFDPRCFFDVKHTYATVGDYTIEVTADDGDGGIAVESINASIREGTVSPPPVTDPTVPVTDPTVPVTDPTVPVTDPTVPVTDPTVPVTDPTVPVTDPTVPVTDPTVPVTDPTVPVTDPTVPVTDPTVPVTDPTVPVTDPTVPVTDPTVPVTDPTVPVTDPTVPVTGPTVPVTGPTVPVTDPTVAVTGPTVPSAGNDSASIGRVKLTASVGEFSAVGIVDRATLPPVPASVTFPFGVFRFSIVGVPVGGSVTVTFAAPDTVNSYWKLDNGVWVQVPSVLVPGGIAVTLVDGGLGDADGIANGVIVDPGALGVSVQTPPPPGETPTVGGGGASVATTPASFEPAGVELPATGRSVGGWLVGAALLLGLGLATVLLARRRPSDVEAVRGA